MLLNFNLFLMLECVAVSTIMYLYLHKKTRIRLKFLAIDNPIVFVTTYVITFLISGLLPSTLINLQYVLALIFVPFLGFSLTMYRFWHTPTRTVKAKDNELISPADGNVIYIKKVEAGDVPISIKKGVSVKLSELTKTDILEKPCWLVGINMTPFDVHKNCSPINGKVILNKHFSGSYLSLKNDKAVIENEQQTIVVQNEKETIGIVQTASRLVRRIDSYIKEGNTLNRGQWFGMVRFGSQVDIILPLNYDIQVELGQQIYAVDTVIASKE